MQNIGVLLNFINLCCLSKFLNNFYLTWCHSLLRPCSMGSEGHLFPFLLCNLRCTSYLELFFHICFFFECQTILEWQVQMKKKVWRKPESNLGSRINDTTLQPLDLHQCCSLIHDYAANRTKKIIPYFDLSKYYKRKIAYN